MDSTKPRAIGRTVPAEMVDVLRVNPHAVDRLCERFPHTGGLDREELAGVLETLVEEGRLMTVRQCHDRFRNGISEHGDRRVVYTPSIHGLIVLRKFNEHEWLVWTIFPAKDRTSACEHSWRMDE